jgi:hypothetical protein
MYIILCAVILPLVGVVLVWVCVLGGSAFLQSSGAGWPYKLLFVVMTSFQKASHFTPIYAK